MSWPTDSRVCEIPLRNVCDTVSAYDCLPFLAATLPLNGKHANARILVAWRKVLKDLITYFREIQSHYEQRGKSLVKLANVANNISTPPQFLRSAGIDDALQFLRNYNKAALQEANKAKEIEEDVILALTGLRSDLQQKIKEIKHLSGDFKNSVDREMENTSKAVRALADVLDKTEVDSSTTTGKQDPYLMRLAVDRQVERQIDEENYLHQVRIHLLINTQITPAQLGIWRKYLYAGISLLTLFVIGIFES